MEKTSQPQEPKIPPALYRVLESVGLPENERKLYALSLELGPVPVAKLAEHLDIPRPNVYKLIAGLERRGLARFSERARKNKRFMVEPPSAVMDALRRQKETLSSLDTEFVEVMPRLLSLYRQGELPTKVQIFTFQKDMLEKFDEVSEQAVGEVCFFGSSDWFIEFIGKSRLEKDIKRRAAKGIKTRLLIFGGENAQYWQQRDAEHLRETRILSAPKPFATSFYLYGNKALVWQPVAPLAISVEDQYIVEMLRNIFDAFWEISR